MAMLAASLSAARAVLAERQPEALAAQTVPLGAARAAYQKVALEVLAASLKVAARAALMAEAPPAVNRRS